VIRIEKRTSPTSEASNFDAELEKRNTGLMAQSKRKRLMRWLDIYSMFEWEG
jgi:hypothetical protein